MSIHNLPPKEKNSGVFADFPSQFFIPFKPKIDTRKLNDDEILKAFDDMLTDLSLDENVTRSMMRYTINQKHNFIEMQMMRDSAIPAPESVLKCLAQQRITSVLQCTVQQFHSARTSWTERFCQAGGVQVWFQILDDFAKDHNIPSDIKRIDLLNLILSGFLAILDTKTCQDKVLQFKDLPKLLYQVASINNPKGIRLILSINVQFIIKDTTFDTKNFSQFCDGMGFNALKEILEDPNSEISTKEAIVFFLTTCLSSTKTDALRRIEFASAIRSSKLDITLSFVEGPGKFITSRDFFLDQIKPNIQLLEKLGDNNPYDSQAITNKLFESYTNFRGIQLNLVDIVTNFPEKIKEIEMFVFNFLQIERQVLANKFEISLEDIAVYALGCKNIYVPNVELSDFQLALKLDTGFIDSKSLMTADIEELMKAQKKSQKTNNAEVNVEQLLTENANLKEYMNNVQSSQAQFQQEKKELTKKIQTMQDELDRNNIEMDSLKQQLTKNLRENKTEQAQEPYSAVLSAKVNKLKAEIIESLKKQLEAALAASVPLLPPHHQKS